MERLAYNLKDCFASVKKFIHSPNTLRHYDKFSKIFKSVLLKIVIYAVLVTFSYIFLYPLLKVIIDSLKTNSDLQNPDVVWVPRSLTLSNYKYAIKTLEIYYVNHLYSNVIVSTLFNSALYSFLTATLQTITACLAGYAFARFEFKGKKLWFIGLILAFILPAQLLALPRSMMLRPLINKTASPAILFGLNSNEPLTHKINAIFGIIKTTPMLLITLFGQGINSSILIFIAFSFFKMIPISLDEAAQIDGANFFQIFLHIIIKMSLPTILVVFLFSFIWNWNDSYVYGQLTAALSGNDMKFRTLPEILSLFNDKMSQGSSESHVSENVSNSVGLQSAAIVISIAPLLILYAFTQKKFVEGIENTGVTGV